MLIADSLHNQYVIWSLDSRIQNPPVSCHFGNPNIEASSKPFSKAGFEVLAMTPSNPFNAIVQMDIHGKSSTKPVDVGALHFTQYFDLKHLGTLSEVPHLTLGRPRGAKAPTREATLTFTADGTELLLRIGNVVVLLI